MKTRRWEKVEENNRRKRRKKNIRRKRKEGGIKATAVGLELVYNGH